MKHGLKLAVTSLYNGNNKKYEILETRRNLTLSVFFAFHRKNLVLLNLSSRYMISSSELFFKSKDFVDLYKVNFCISKLFIQCNTDSCCVNIMTGVNKYIYSCLLVCWSLCVLSVFACVSYQLRVLAKTIHPCQTFSTFYAVLHKIHSKVLVVQVTKAQKAIIFWAIILLGTITQTWCDHTFNQRNKATKSWGRK